MPLTLYAYYETPDCQPNLQFVSHTLDAHAIFVLIFNGKTDGELLLSTISSNIDYFKRNTCFDFGAYTEVLKADGSVVVSQHKRFIMIKVALRGSIVHFCNRSTGPTPTWAN